MPAEGRNNAAGIAADVHAGNTVYVLLTDQPGKAASAHALAGSEPANGWHPARRKTQVVTARVTGSTTLVNGRRCRRYTLYTDRGDVANLAPIETLALGTAPAAPPAAPADVVGVDVDGVRVATVRRIDITAADQPARTVYGYATRVTMREAREHFDQGGHVLVSEHGHEPTSAVGPSTTTHSKATTTWDALAVQVREWRGRYPNQRYYTVPADVTAQRDAARAGTPDPVKLTAAVAQLIDGYAAKFHADTAGATYAGPDDTDVPGEYVEPTDENLARILAHCVKPPTRDMYADIRAAFHRLVGQLPDYPMSHVQGGDVIRLDGDPVAHKVGKAWWSSPETAHYLHFDGEPAARKWARDGAPDVTLVERPGWGPFTHVYEVGDRVGVIGAGLDRREVAGVVAEVHAVPSVGRWWFDRCYEVQTAIGGLITAGPDRMRPDSTPMPAVGQVWYCEGTDHYITVTGVNLTDYPSGLVADTDRTHSIELAAPHWRIATADDLARRDAPAEPQTPDGPDPDLVDAVMRYGSAGASDGMRRIAALQTDRVVAAILERVPRLTEAERARLSDAGLLQFQRHRVEMSTVRHRVAKACPDGWRDFGMVADRAWSATNQPGLGPATHTFAAHAVSDVVWATVAREYLDDDEYRMFARPWLDLAGE